MTTTKIQGVRYSDVSLKVGNYEAEIKSFPISIEANNVFQETNISAYNEMCREQDRLVKEGFNKLGFSKTYEICCNVSRFDFAHSQAGGVIDLGLSKYTGIKFDNDKLSNNEILFYITES